MKCSGIEPKPLQWGAELQQDYWPYISNYIEQSHYCEADCHSAGQKIFWLLWDPKFFFSVRKNFPLHPILSQPSLDHDVFIDYFFFILI
jgi:hypothetical protein